MKENDQVSATATDLSTYIEQMEAKFITESNRLVNGTILKKTVEPMGIEKYLEVYQTAYNRWKEN